MIVHVSQELTSICDLNQFHEHAKHITFSSGLTNIIFKVGTGPKSVLIPSSC